MGLERFERRLERLVEGAFAKTYRRGLQPVEIGRRLTREMDLQRTAGIRGTIAPNIFRVVLSEEDVSRFESFAEALSGELVEAARQHARQEGYALLGPVEVELLEDSDLRPGVFLIETEVQEGPGGGPAAALVTPSGDRVPLEEEPLVIGRLPECQLRLDDPNVSRRHAEIRRQDGYVTVVDLGSTNGTLVNGVPAKERRLNEGDRITVGRTTLTFEMG